MSSIEHDQRVFHCLNCEAELIPASGQTFVRCEQCGASMVIENDQVYFHYYVEPSLNENEAQSNLFRWMAGSQSVHGLDKNARLISSLFQFFPLWYFKVRRNGSSEKVMIQPGKAISITDFLQFKISPGILKRVDEQFANEMGKGNIPLDIAQRWLLKNQISTPGLETFLVHVPVYMMKYVHQKKVYTALVEAGTGKVFANIFPTGSQGRFGRVAALAALVYISLALLPVLAVFFGNQAYGISVIISTLLGCLLSVPLFILARRIASKK